MAKQSETPARSPLREELIRLIYEHIATPHEIERSEAVRQAGGATRTLRAQRGRTVDVHKLADDILALVAPTGAGAESIAL